MGDEPKAGFWGRMRAWLGWDDEEDEEEKRKRAERKAKQAQEEQDRLLHLEQLRLVQKEEDKRRLCARREEERARMSAHWEKLAAQGRAIRQREEAERLARGEGTEQKQGPTLSM